MFRSRETTSTASSMLIALTSSITMLTRCRSVSPTPVVMLRSGIRKSLPKSSKSITACSLLQACPLRSDALSVKISSSSVISVMVSMVISVSLSRALRLSTATRLLQPLPMARCVCRLCSVLRPVISSLSSLTTMSLPFTGTTPRSRKLALVLSRIRATIRSTAIRSHSMSLSLPDLTSAMSIRRTLLRRPTSSVSSRSTLSSTGDSARTLLR